MEKISMVHTVGGHVYVHLSAHHLCAPYSVRLTHEEAIIFRDDLDRRIKEYQP